MFPFFIFMLWQLHPSVTNWLFSLKTTGVASGKQTCFFGPAFKISATSRRRNPAANSASVLFKISAADYAARTEWTCQRKSGGSRNVGTEDVVVHPAPQLGREVSRHEILHMSHKNWIPWVGLIAALWKCLYTLMSSLHKCSKYIFVCIYTVYLCVCVCVWSAAMINSNANHNLSDIKSKFLLNSLEKW